MLHAPFILMASLLAVGLLLAFLVLVAAWSRHKKSSTAELSLVGRLASVEEPLEPEGSVLIGGELWRARLSGAAHPVARGRSNVRVTGARGHLLLVEPLD
jgi:membrane protein implicated in regulation of membrane protease activity